MPALPDAAPSASPAQVRARIRAGEITGPTAALCPGYVQANLVILPRDWAEDFLAFCRNNPRPCPLLEVLPAGSPHTRRVAEGADLRYDLPRYRVWREGELQQEPTDIAAWWREDLVSFLLGCSFSFDAALTAAGVPVRHLEEGRNIPMYRTNRANVPAGRFGGWLVVSMRPLPPELVPKAVEVSRRLPLAHGEPVQVGDPASLGIEDLSRPHYGEAVSLRPGEVPVFWACGVTPQAAIAEAKPPLAITHAPGHMFITDLKVSDLERLEPADAIPASA